MGMGSFLEVKQPGRGVYHPPPSSAKVKKRVELYLYTPFVTCSRVKLNEIEIYCYTKEINSLYFQCMFPSFENLV
jgi:hypothetical protein